MENTIKKKILIVDDSDSARKKMSMFLEEDYIVVEAENGQHAFDLLKENQDFDLIIMDVNMPEIGGMEFIEFQSKEENLKSIPTMMCTTEASQKMKEKAKEFCVVRAWLIKPIIKETFLKTVKHVLKKT